MSLSPDEARQILELPLLWTFYDEQVVVRGLPEDEILKLRTSYSSERFKRLSDALRWASRNPDEDFAVLIPRIPFDNKKLYSYLCLLHRQLARPVE